MTVGELGARMSSREFVEWFAFYEMEPFGPTRDNLHAAQISSILYNSNRNRKAPPMSPSDFMYRDPYHQRENDTSGFLAGLRSLAKRKNV